MFSVVLQLRPTETTTTWQMSAVDMNFAGHWSRSRCAGWRIRLNSRLPSVSLRSPPTAVKGEPPHPAEAPGSCADERRLHATAPASASSQQIMSPQESPQQQKLATQPEMPWWGANPQLEQKIPALIQDGRVAEARTLLRMCAVEQSPVTQFFLGVATGMLDGEAAACEFYERALKQQPLLHPARKNLIRSLMKRGRADDARQAKEQAELSVGLQPGDPEIHYQYGVVLMQQGLFDEAALAYESTLRLEPTHRGAIVNGVHSLQQFAPDDKNARMRLMRVAEQGVQAGLYMHPMQRCPHLVRGLTSKPWHDPRAFPFVQLLESQFSRIKAEILKVRQSPEALTPVGGRAAHDHTLVAAGEWREFPLFGNGQKYPSCMHCPVTAALVESIPEAVELAMAGGGETLFSVLRSGTHLRPHCGSTNTRLTAHLGLVVPSGCTIRTGGETRTWEEGKCIVFDDSWEHEVVHSGAEDRSVLLINFWHPDLPPSARRIDVDYYGYEPG